jgi:hypothetical protein
VDENRVGDRHPVVQEYCTASRSAPDAESTRCARSSRISNSHPGTKSCKANALLDFLRSHYAEILYQIGDIVDGWNSGRSCGQAYALALRINDWYRRVRFKFGRRSLRIYLKRFLSKAASRLTATRFDEVRL